MADTGSGLAGGVDAVEHIGRQLYAQALGASRVARGAAGTLQSEVGESAFAHAIKDGRRPPDSVWQHLDSWYDFHTDAHQDLNEAIERSKNTHSQLFAQALQGEAGEALQAKLRDNHQLWGAHADKHQAAGLASYQVSAIVQNAQGEIDRIAEDGEQKFYDAVQRHDPVGALQVWRTYSGQADSVVTRTAPTVARVLREADFDIPLDTPPKPGDGTHTDQDDKKPKVKPATNEHHKDGAHSDLPGDGTDGTHSDLTPGDDNPPVSVQPTGDGTHSDLLPGPGQTPFMPTNFGPSGSGSGLGSGAGGRGGRVPSLGSGFPSQLGSMGGTGAGTLPASAVPQAPSAGTVSPASASSLANTGSSFQSGLASGMGVTGGMAAPVAPPAQQPTAPIRGASQPPVAAPNAVGAGMSQAGVGSGTGWAAQPVDSAGLSGGHGGAPVSGGGALIPPAGMAAQPLAPYSPPGAGAPGAGSGVPGAPTSPAGGSGAGVGGPGGGSGPPGAPPMLAGNPGSSGAMSALATSSTDVNPDLITAQRILGELVQGGEQSKMLVLWAVVVLRSPVGSHIAVANNVGGGGYLPATVYLPSTVRLAVNDAALPIGWADVWMGCQFPSKILIDYCDRLRKVSAGVSVSALVTTELWADPPAGFTGDFVGMDHRDALRLVNEASTPKLDAAHQHRLAVLDPGLFQRVNGLDRGRDISAWAAATLTRTVFQEASNADGTGSPLVEHADAEMLQAVSSGAATPAMWASYDRSVEQRHNGAVAWPSGFAPRDNDDSDAARAAILWYTHYYQIGRMIELIQSWKGGTPRLAELAYCGIKAGFGPTVVTTIAAMEQHLTQRRQSAAH
ncbi:hypothetical protein LRC484719_27790 [Mycobacterium riyadhense]